MAFRKSTCRLKIQAYLQYQLVRVLPKIINFTEIIIILGFASFETIRKGLDTHMKQFWCSWSKQRANTIERIKEHVNEQNHERGEKQNQWRKGERYYKTNEIWQCIMKIQPKHKGMVWRGNKKTTRRTTRATRRTKQQQTMSLISSRFGQHSANQSHGSWVHTVHYSTITPILYSTL